MIPDPAAGAQKWANRLGAATDAVQKGVQAVQTSPTATAAQHQDAYVAGVQRAAQTGKWARGLNRVNLQQWQQATLQKGIPRIASGAQAAVPKMTAFNQQF